MQLSCYNLWLHSACIINTNIATDLFNVDGVQHKWKCEWTTRIWSTRAQGARGEMGWVVPANVPYVQAYQLPRWNDLCSPLLFWVISWQYLLNQKNTK